MNARVMFRAVGMIALVAMTGCLHSKPAAIKMPPSVNERKGEEIVVAGKLFHVGAPVVLWTDKGGYDMFDTGPTTLPATQPLLPRRRGMRTTGLTDAEIEQVRSTGWTIPLIQKCVDQFIIHYDVDLVSNTCFRVLKQRGLGVQFMLDLDGTIYQTMDLAESAPHATKANGRSVGVEIANIGAYAKPEDVEKYYGKDQNGATILKVPEKQAATIRTPNFIAYPARKELVTGPVNGGLLNQYDFTPQQYESLIKLTATLCTVFPKIQPDYPRQKSTYGTPTTRASKMDNDATTKPIAIATPHEKGQLIPHTLSNDQYDNFQGVMGHYHVQTDKIDPGPAFQWFGFMEGVRALMSKDAVNANTAMFGQPVKNPDRGGATSRPSRGMFGGRRNGTSRPATTQATTKP